MTFLILFLTTFAIADSQPSKVSCEYYQDLEKKLNCGDDGYLKAWGYPLCIHYLREEKNSEMREELKAWLPEVRFCLQQSLQTKELELNCKNLEKIAIDTHTSCYQHTGFCKLSSNTKMQLIYLSRDYAFDPLTYKTWFKVQRACF